MTPKVVTRLAKVSLYLDTLQDSATGPAVRLQVPAFDPGVEVWLVFVPDRIVAAVPTQVRDALDSLLGEGWADTTTQDDHDEGLSRYTRQARLFEPAVPG